MDGDGSKPQSQPVAGLASINQSSHEQEEGSHLSFSEVDALFSSVYEPGPVGPAWAAIKQGEPLENVVRVAIGALSLTQTQSPSSKAETKMRYAPLFSSS